MNFKLIEHESALFADSVFENVQLKKGKKDLYQDYTLPYSQDCKIKKNITPEKLECLLSSLLQKVCCQDKEDFEEDPYSVVMFEQINRLLLKVLVVHVPMDYFVNVIRSFEKVVSMPEVYGKTTLYRSILLNTFGCFNLKENKERIKFICNSPTLIYEDNSCDRITAINDDHFMAITKEFYENFVPVAWNIMSVFHAETNIVKNCFPDEAGEFLSSYNITTCYLNLRNMQKLDLSKINAEIMLKKFTLSLLNGIQSHLDKGKLKNNLNAIISKDMNLQDKKYLLLQPLSMLNMNAFKEMKKLYPGIIEKINYEDVLSMDISLMAAYSHSENNKELTTTMITKYKLSSGEKSSSDLKDNVRENIWKIISTDRSLEEKGVLKKAVSKPSTKSKIKKDNRI